jgi:hypothetical protein
MLTSCKVSSSAISDADKSKCEFMGSVPNDKVYHQIVYEHKGIDLYAFMKKTPYKLLDTFEYVLNICKGIRMINGYKLTHADLKPDNVLITDNKKAILIDFGMTRKFSDLYNLGESEYILEYAYDYYPPEFNLFRGLVTRRKADAYSKDFSARFLADIKRKYSSMVRNDLMSAELIDRQIREFSAKFDGERLAHKLTKNKAITEYFVSHFAPKADVFAVGVIMQFLYKASADKDTLDSNVNKQYLKITSSAMHLDPYQRTNIDSLIRNLETLIGHKTTSPPRETIRKPSQSNPSDPKQTDTRSRSISKTRNSPIVIDEHDVIIIESSRSSDSSIQEIRPEKYRRLLDHRRHGVSMPTEQVSVNQIPNNRRSEERQRLLLHMSKSKSPTSPVRSATKTRSTRSSRSGSNSSDTPTSAVSHFLSEDEGSLYSCSETSSSRSSSSQEKEKRKGKGKLTTTRCSDSTQKRVSDCMKYFKLQELKDLVTELKLSPHLKYLNKEELCKKIHMHLKMTNNGSREVVKRGRKQKKITTPESSLSSSIIF